MSLIDTRQEVWLRAYCTAATSGVPVNAVEVADRCLDEFNRRFYPVVWEKEHKKEEGVGTGCEG